MAYQTFSPEVRIQDWQWHPYITDPATEIPTDSQMDSRSIHRARKVAARPYKAHLMSPSLWFLLVQGAGYSLSEKYQWLRILLFAISACSHKSQESSSYYTLQVKKNSYQKKEEKKKEEREYLLWYEEMGETSHKILNFKIVPTLFMPGWVYILPINPCYF